MKSLLIYTIVFLLGLSVLVFAAPQESDSKRGCIASAHQATKNGFALDLTPCESL